LLVQLNDLPKLDCILITQGYDDHCHKKTLTALVEKFSEVRVIASPNCESIMGKIGYRNVRISDFCWLSAHFRLF
jgi:L-ascorbate metabolism protein UlaG (beta-lactamase superfamily)